jgi:hypothetical protein
MRLPSVRFSIWAQVACVSIVGLAARLPLILSERQSGRTTEWAMLSIAAFAPLALVSFPILVLSCIASTMRRRSVGRTALAILLVEFSMCAAFLIAFVPAIQ